MVVRDATAADAPVLAPLLGELGYPAAADALASRMRRMLGRDDQRVFVAERDGATLGLLALHVFPVLAYDRDLAMIMALVVTERALGLGVGRARIQRAEVVGKSLGASRLMVTTHVSMHQGHSTWRFGA